MEIISIVIHLKDILPNSYINTILFQIYIYVYDLPLYLLNQIASFSCSVLVLMAKCFTPKVRCLRLYCWVKRKSWWPNHRHCFCCQFWPLSNILDNLFAEPCKSNLPTRFLLTDWQTLGFCSSLWANFSLLFIIESWLKVFLHWHGVSEDMRNSLRNWRYVIFELSEAESIL